MQRPASQPVSPDAPITLNFKDASVRSILEYLSEAAGLVIVEEARVEGRVTLMSRQYLSVEEAVSLLDTALKERGYAAVRNGRVLKVVTIDQAKKELIPVRAGNDPAKIPASDRMITQIIPIRSADAVKLKADLASLTPPSADVTSNAASNTLIVTGTEATVRRIVEIIRAIDVHMAEVSQVRVFQLKYANAVNAARLITDIFREEQPTQQSLQGLPGGVRRAFMMFGMPGQRGQQAGATEEQGQRGVRVTAAADERTNTLVVSASPDVLKVIEAVVKELDANPAAEQAVFVYRLKNAQAKNLETVLNSIFGGTGATSTGTTAARQGTGTTGGAFGGFGGFGGAFGGTGAAGGRTGTGGALSTGFGAAARTSTAGQTGFRAGQTAQAARAPARTAAAASELAGQVYVVADADTNSLVVTTASGNFERVKAVIADLDRAVPQVLIKVLIAEVTHTNSLDLGTEFSALNLRASGKGFSAGTDFSVSAAIKNTTEMGGFEFKLDEQNVTAAIRAIAEVTKLDVLSRPYILTGDNQQATIMVGQSVPLITNSRTTETGQTINTIQYNDIGIILSVTPHINPQGLVTMDIYPEISTLTSKTVPISETVSAPVYARRFAQSRVAIRDGQTIVIGGLMEDRNTKTVDKVPLLGDIPVLGLLFQRTVDEKDKTELLVFLTPHVAQQPDELQGMSKAEVEGAKIAPNAVEEGAFQEHLKGLERGASTQPSVQEPSPDKMDTAPPPEEEELDDTPP